MTSQHIGPTCKPAGSGSRPWVWDQMQRGLACVVLCVIFTTNIVHAWPTGKWPLRSHLQACWYWKQALSLGPDAVWLSLCGVLNMLLPTWSHPPSRQYSLSPQSISLPTAIVILLTQNFSTTSSPIYFHCMACQVMTWLVLDWMMGVPHYYRITLFTIWWGHAQGTKDKAQSNIPTKSPSCGHAYTQSFDPTAVKITCNWYVRWVVGMATNYSPALY